MKLYTTLLSVLFFHFGFSQNWLELMQSSGNVNDAKKEFDQYWEGNTIEKGKGYKQFMRWYNFWAPRTYPSGDISEVNPGNGIQQHLDLQEYNRTLKSSTSPWTTMGPYSTNSGYNGIGRINTIAFHPTDPNTWFIGTPGGGLWKTTDAGSSWTPLTDFLTNLGISDIAISNTNPDVIYIATGDRDARDTYSFGVLKSTDGGDTWNNTGLSSMVQNTWTTNRILINPSNANILIVATGDGIYRSTDAGGSFTHVQTSGHFISMEFNPADPNIVYASQFDYWNEQATFFKSVDNGQSWTPITSGLPNNNCRRIHIGVTPANANYVYLITVDNDNGMEGFYRSANAGSSFNLMTSSPNTLDSGDGTGTGGQGWYDLSLAVSPTNADEVYVGGVNMWKSTNGGTNFTKMTHWYNNGTTVIHADQHWFDFFNGGLFVCNDGGLYVSYDGANSFSDLSNGLTITQYYRLSNDQNTNDKLVAGAQDNGSDLLDSGTWNDVQGGDGMHCIVDHTDPNIVFTATQYGNIYRSTNGGYNYVDVSPDPGNGAWITPYEMAPSNNNIMYCGYNDIYKSTDNGVNWSLTTSGLSAELLRSIEVSKTDANVVYCASFEQVFKSTNGGNTFTDVTGTLPVGNVSISSICIDPTDENRVWITFSGYSAGEKVFRTDDGGSSWVNQTGSLPNLPTNKLIYEEGSSGVLYAGTDVGVYYWDPNNSVWDIYGTDLPNVIVNDLDIQYSQGVLRAATYGRGIWEISMSPSNPPTADFSASSTSVCEGSIISFSNNSLLGDTYEWTFDGGNPATSTDTNPVVAYDTPGVYDVELIAYNQSGSDTAQFTGHITVQANQLSTQPLGNATNIYTNTRNQTNPIVVDNELNTIIFAHRQNINEFSGTSGMLRYDYSTNDGQSWSLNNGVLNPSAVAGTNDSRYPQVNIYNPNGNNIPSNAKLIYHAPTVGATWNGYVSGDGNIGSGTYTENYNQASASNTLIPGNLVKGAPGVYWSLDALWNGTTFSGLQLLKGSWNGSSVVWSVQETFNPNFDLTQDGTPKISSNSFSVAFDPSGQNGWMVFLSHLDGTITNYQYYPVFYQTTDGGNTWSGPIEVDLSSFPSITSNLTGGVVAAAFDIDLSVDANGNPHTLFNVCSGDNTNYTIQQGEWMGACHLHHNGTAWEADILNQIQTLRYTLSDGSFMDNTPQVSRSDDGNILTFSWTDSDPVATGGDNSQPFLNLMAYNVSSDVYSSLETADICSLDPGKIAFLHCANALLETTQGYEVAAVISDINSTGSGLDETGHKYFSFPIPNVCSASASITTVNEACVGENVTITDNSSNTLGYTYNWDVENDGTFDYTTTGNITHTYSNSGTKTINLVLDDGNGCLTSTTYDINIHDLPALNVSHPSVVCGLDQIDYTDNSSVSAPATYSWDFDGDGNTDASTSGNQIFTPSTMGALNGELTVTDVNGCSNTLALDVQIDLQPTADFTGPTLGCVGDAVTFTDNSQDGTMYDWDIDTDGSSDYNISGDVSHVYNASGLYSVTLDLSNGNCSDSHVIQINIEDDPVADFTIIDQGGNSYLFQDQSSGGGTYQWNFGDGNISNVGGDVSHTYADENAYTVTLTLTNNCGSDSFFDQITSTAGVNEVNQQLLVYPNPTNGQFTVESPQLTGLNYMIKDNLGRIIDQGYFETSKTILDLSGFASGMYHLELQYEDGMIIRKVNLRK